MERSLLPRRRRSRDCSIFIQRRVVSQSMRPRVFENTESAYSLEQELTQAMVDCATSGTGEADNASSLRNHDIMKRFHAVVEERGPLPLYVHEICVALGVSSRSLLRCCSEQLGVSPHRYLWLRRMNMARHALLHSILGHESVTDIAVRFRILGTRPVLGRLSRAIRQIAFGNAAPFQLPRSDPLTQARPVAETA